MEKNSRETKDKIIKAFMKLYREKRIDKITISEIAKEANIYRGTFYYYYEDIYNLLESIEDEFFSIAMNMVDKIVESIYVGDIEAKIGEIYKLFMSCEEKLRLFMVDKPNGGLIRKMKRTAKEKVLKKFNIDINKLLDEEKYMLESIASSQIGLVIFWLENNRDISPVNLLRIMKIVNTEGAMTYLRNIHINTIKV